MTSSCLSGSTPNLDSASLNLQLDSKETDYDATPTHGGQLTLDDIAIWLRLSLSTLTSSSSFQLNGIDYELCSISPSAESLVSAEAIFCIYKLYRRLPSSVISTPPESGLQSYYTEIRTRPRTLWLRVLVSEPRRHYVARQRPSIELVLARSLADEATPASVKQHISNEFQLCRLGLTGLIGFKDRLQQSHQRLRRQLEQAREEMDISKDTVNILTRTKHYLSALKKRDLEHWSHCVSLGLPSSAMLSQHEALESVAEMAIVQESSSQMRCQETITSLKQTLMGKLHIAEDPRTLDTSQDTLLDQYCQSNASLLLCTPQSEHSNPPFSGAMALNEWGISYRQIKEININEYYKENCRSSRAEFKWPRKPESGHVPICLEPSRGGIDGYLEEFNPTLLRNRIKSWIVSRAGLNHDEIRALRDITRDDIEAATLFNSACSSLQEYEKGKGYRPARQSQPRDSSEFEHQGDASLLENWDAALPSGFDDTTEPAAIFVLPRTVAWFASPSDVLLSSSEGRCLEFVLTEAEQFSTSLETLRPTLRVSWPTMNQHQRLHVMNLLARMLSVIWDQFDFLDDNLPVECVSGTKNSASKERGMERGSNSSVFKEPTPTAMTGDSMTGKSPPAMPSIRQAETMFMGKQCSSLLPLTRKLTKVADTPVEPVHTPFASGHAITHETCRIDAIEMGVTNFMKSTREVGAGSQRRKRQSLEKRCPRDAQENSQQRMTTTAVAATKASESRKNSEKGSLAIDSDSRNEPIASMRQWDFSVDDLILDRPCSGALLSSQHQKSAKLPRFAGVSRWKRFKLSNVRGSPEQDDSLPSSSNDCQQTARTSLYPLVHLFSMPDILSSLMHPDGPMTSTSTTAEGPFYRILSSLNLEAARFMKLSAREKERCLYHRWMSAWHERSPKAPKDTRLRYEIIQEMSGLLKRGSPEAGPISKERSRSDKKRSQAAMKRAEKLLYQCQQSHPSLHDLLPPRDDNGAMTREALIRKLDKSVRESNMVLRHMQEQRNTEEQAKRMETRKFEGMCTLEQQLGLGANWLYSAQSLLSADRIGDSVAAAVLDKTGGCAKRSSDQQQKEQQCQGQQGQQQPACYLNEEELALVHQHLSSNLPEEDILDHMQ